VKRVAVHDNLPVADGGCAHLLFECDHLVGRHETIIHTSTLALISSGAAGILVISGTVEADDHLEIQPARANSSATEPPKQKPIATRRSLST
jgi:hypothetical protein